MHYESFKELIDWQLSRNFDEFVTLYHPGPKKPWEYASEREFTLAVLNDRYGFQAGLARLHRFGRAQDRQAAWLAKVKAYAGEAFRYLMVIEDRKWKRDFQFHILLRGCDSLDLDNYFFNLWKEMSGGIAFRRQMDERIRGLLWHLVIKRNCFLELDNGDRYSGEEFEEWEGSE